MKSISWESFPNVPLAEDRLCFAGTLMYTPDSELSQQIIQALQSLLTSRYRMDGEEMITRVEVDWDLLKKGKEDVTLRSQVFLWSAGTEEATTNEHWQNAALLFYRQDTRIVDATSPRPITHRVHIPDQSGQDALLSACRDVLDELRAGKTDAFEEITEYLTAILDDDSAWAAEELNETAQLAVSENLETYQGLQPEMTITQLDEEEREKKPEQGPLHRYQVEVSTHQMLHQTIEMVSATPLSKEQITERAIEEAQKGEWTRGAIGRSVDIDDLLAEF